MELAPGVDYVRTADVKDQIELSGNDIQAVSMTGKRLFCVTRGERERGKEREIVFFFFKVFIFPAASSLPLLACTGVMGGERLQLEVAWHTPGGV